LRARMSGAVSRLISSCTDIDYLAKAATPIR
jgi:hypothetical protein